MYDRLYRYVLEVAKQGSVTAAAEELYVTPSALSKAIQKLEQDLGTPLFDRVGKSFYPTFAGTQFLARAEKIVDLQEQLRQEMEDITSLHAGRVRLGLQLNTASRAVQAIARFRQEFPQIELQVIENTSLSLAKMLEDGEVDLVISDADPEIQRSFRLSVLSSNELILVVPRNHKLVKQAVWMKDRKYPVISLDLCREEPFILPFSDQRMGVILENILKGHGLPVNAPLRATSVGTILNMVAAGLGITITYDLTAEPYENSLNLTFLSFEKTLYQNLVVATNPDRYLSDAGYKLIDYCIRIYSGQPTVPKERPV